LARAAGLISAKFHGTGGSSKNFRMTVSPVFPRPRLRRQEFQSFQAREGALAAGIGWCNLLA
jgi:hypothetical protein